jgi:hypothetical protein
MITRTFLFILALVTGFSAANAADRSRGLPAEVGAVTSIVLSQTIPAQSSRSINAGACFIYSKPFNTTLSIDSGQYRLACQNALFSCVYRSDRTRE